MKYLLFTGMAVGSLALIRMPSPCCDDGDQAQAPVVSTTRPAKAAVTYHVIGMKKTKSGAT